MSWSHSVSLPFSAPPPALSLINLSSVAHQAAASIIIIIIIVIIITTDPSLRLSLLSFFLFTFLFLLVSQLQ